MVSRRGTGRAVAVVVGLVLCVGCTGGSSSGAGSVGGVGGGASPEEALANAHAALVAKDYGKLFDQFQPSERALVTFGTLAGTEMMVAMMGGMQSLGKQMGEALGGKENPKAKADIAAVKSEFTALKSKYGVTDEAMKGAMAAGGDDANAAAEKALAGVDQRELFVELTALLDDDRLGSKTNYPFANEPRD